MKIKPLHPNFELPVRSTELAGGYDLFMPTSGSISGQASEGKLFGLGFAAAVPPGHVALILPRSGAGSKRGVMLNNTCGVIDADYRGEWKVMIRVLNKTDVHWEIGERLFQFLIVPVLMPQLEVTYFLEDTDRGEGGFGSTGNGRA